MRTGGRTANLFEQQRICKHSNPHTSYGAAQKVVESGLQKTDHEKILAVLNKRPDYDEYHQGLTCNEISFELTGTKERNSWYYKIARRMKELKEAGEIYVVCSRISAIGGMQALAYKLGNEKQNLNAILGVYNG